MLEKILKNGFTPLIPILVWNLIFISKLPEAYKPQSFNENIPILITFGENVFRLIIFILPFFFQIGLGRSTQKRGLILFLFGTMLYFSSWLLLIYLPTSWWSSSVIGFSAPAYTPIIWLLGLCLMVDKYYKFTYSWWHYFLPVIVFIIFHVSHSVYVYNRYYGV